MNTETEAKMLGPMPVEGNRFRGAVGLIALLSGIAGFILLFFVPIPEKNENAIMLALGLVLGWGSAVVSSEYGSSATGRKAADATIKRAEGM